MNEQEIIYLALENLQKNVQIQGKWEAFDHGEPDGQIILDIADQPVRFYVEIKKELRNHDLQQMTAFNQQYKPFMVVATRLFPKIKEELRLNNIAYLEANGNLFLKNKDTTLWIDTNKPLKTYEKTGNRAFTKTGLKVMFLFLLDETWINRPYRQIAGHTGTGIGNITNIIKGLKQEGFLLPLAKNEYKLNNKRELLNKWVTAYDLKLKPTIKMGTFRFLKEEDFTNWKNLPIRNGKTWWGGEPAGDLLTFYLRPAELTLYTTETRNDLIKNYRLIPDDTGNVQIYQKFWQYDNGNDNVVPPLLVYTDLMNKGDRRCTETAQKIYDEFLQSELPIGLRPMGFGLQRLALLFRSLI
ncbi:type IV toxin-antitoxin system AbiEi family antitoxin [Niabella terrae]